MDQLLIVNLREEGTTAQLAVERMTIDQMMVRYIKKRFIAFW